MLVAKAGRRGQMTPPPLPVLKGLFFREVFAKRSIFPRSVCVLTGGIIFMEVLYCLEFVLCS